MAALGTDIRSSIQCLKRKPIAEMKVGPMGFVHHHRDVMFMNNFHDLFQVGGDSVVGRVNDQYPFGIRMLMQALATVSGVTPIANPRSKSTSGFINTGTAPLRIIPPISNGGHYGVR